MSPGILIIFSIILFWTYYTSYTNIDLVHSFTGNSFKFDFGATEESKSPPSDRRSDVKSNGILFPSFSLLTVAYHSCLHTSRHYSSPPLEQHSLPRRGIFTSHSLQLKDIFKYGAGGNFNFPYSLLATLTISNMAPEGIYIFPKHSWQHCLFQKWRRREIFPYSLLVTVGNFHSSQLATLTFSNLSPEGGSHVTGEVGG